LESAGYGGYLTIEISVMVQNRSDYSAAEVAARSYRTLINAASEART
jgi:hypothetical protein